MSSGMALLYALLAGCVLGAVYGFLRPVQRRFSVPADLVFVAVMIWPQAVPVLGCAGVMAFVVMGAICADRHFRRWR